MRPILFQIHLWCGLVLCLPLVLIGLSGSVLVYHDELEALFGPPPVRAAAEGALRSAGAIADAARAAAPGLELRTLNMPERPGAPATVRMSPRGANFRAPGAVSILVDPASLAVLDRVEGGGGGGFMRLMHDLHGHLLIREGATLVQGVDDILESIRPIDPRTVRTPAGSGSAVGPETSTTSAPRRAATTATA